MDETITGFMDALYAVEDPIKNFKKNTYEAQFRQFEKEHGVCFKDLEQSVLSGEDGGTRKLSQMAEMIAEKVAEELRALAKEPFRQNRLMDYNMVLVTYYFPAALDLMPQSGTQFVDHMILAWKEQFPQTDLKPATFEEINAGFRQRYCYITTAVCKSLGKTDECYELNLLRNYRDDYLSRQKNGKELIRRYYDIAPTIVKRINRREDCAVIYQDIWQTYLKPCIAYIEHGKKKECMDLYTNMVYDLQEKYFM